MLNYLREKIFDVDRLFQILILLVIFLIGGCNKNEIIDPLTNIQKEALNYLPGESRFVVYFNLDELKKTDFWDNYFKTSLLGNKSDNQGFRKFEKLIGIGLNNGISQIFISSKKNYWDAAAIILDENSQKIKYEGWKIELNNHVKVIRKENISPRGEVREEKLANIS